MLANRGSFGTFGFMYTQRAVGGKAPGSGLIELLAPKVSPAKGEAIGSAPLSVCSPPDFFLFTVFLTVEGHNGLFLLISVQSMLPTSRRAFDLSTPNSLRMLRRDPLTRTRLESQPTAIGRAAIRIFASAAEAARSPSHTRESSLILGSARCAHMRRTRV